MNFFGSTGTSSGLCSKGRLNFDVHSVMISHKFADFTSSGCYQGTDKEREEISNTNKAYSIPTENVLPRNKILYSRGHMRTFSN